MQSERGIPITKPNIRLKQERELRGWSQSKVAEEVGTSAKIVSRWECGTSSPSPYFRAKLCTLYEKNAHDLGLIPEKSEAGYDPPKALSTPSDVQALLTTTEIVLEAPSPSAPPLPIVNIAEHLQPSVTTGPLQSLHPPRRPGTVFLLIGSALILLSLLLAGTYSILKPASSAQQQRISIQEAQIEAQVFQSKHIGISDGRFAFDVYKERSDIELKQQAAQALQDNNISSAINLFTQAVSVDPTDGEAQIYAENAHVQQSGSPFVTLVLGLPINGIAADLILSRADMEAAFLAQHEINTQGLLPHYKVRLLLDNSGASDNDVGTVAQFIKARIQAGNLEHIVAVIGWPNSLQTIDARDIIASAHLPLISQTASSVALSGSSPYFFRVNPTNNQQGAILGTIATHTLHARTIVVLRDPTDPYSSSLADAFSDSIQPLHGSIVINDPHNYFLEKTTTVAEYQQDVQAALAQKVDVIFIAGLDEDAIRLAHAVGNLARRDPGNKALADLKILGGDAIDTALLLGQGNDPDADIARQFPQDMRRLSFTAFGNVDEWSYLHIPAERQPAFFNDWGQLYQSSPIAANQAPEPGSDALLTYDAIQVTIHAATLVSGNLTGDALRTTLVSLGKDNVPAYQGVSGLISFDKDGNPVNKALALLTVKSTRGNTEENVIASEAVFGAFH